MKTLTAQVNPEGNTITVTLQDRYIDGETIELSYGTFVVAKDIFYLGERNGVYEYEFNLYN